MLARDRGTAVGGAVGGRRLLVPDSSRTCSRGRTFTAEARGGRVRVRGAAGGLPEISRLPLTDKHEIKATLTAGNPVGAHLCAAPSEIVRIHSTSGTTGTPSYIPLTASDLENWVTGSARSYAASGVSPGQRIVSTYNAGPFVAGAALAAFDRIGLCHIPMGTGNTDGLLMAIERLRPEAAVLTPSYAAYLMERATDRGFDLRRSSVERVLVAGEPGGGEAAFRASSRMAGVPSDGGDGYRRHRSVVVGRVRGTGGDAPRRARIRARRADRSRDGRRNRPRGRRER